MEYIGPTTRFTYYRDTRKVEPTEKTQDRQPRCHNRPMRKLGPSEFGDEYVCDVCGHALAGAY